MRKRKPKPSKVFVCVECEKRFVEADLDGLWFFPSTGICRQCYLEAMGDGGTCFGKREHRDERNAVCSQVCPDRNICKLFVELSEGIS